MRDSRGKGDQHMKINCVLAVFGGLLLAGCAAPTHQMATPFRATDFEWSQGKGSANISGQAFLKTRGGDVKTCAGNDVVMVPENAYTRELLTAARAGKDSRGSWDARYQHFRRTTICDAQGGFTFREIPPGPWLVGTTVQWEAPGTSYIANMQGGWLSQSVTTREGETKEIILTDRDR
jgi:putative hemolysin